MPESRDKMIMLMSRRICFLLVLTALVWLGVQWLGGRGLINMRYMVFFDLMALAGFGGALLNAFWLWRVAGKDENAGR